jgi:hypothetical protein
MGTNNDWMPTLILVACLILGTLLAKTLATDDVSLSAKSDTPKRMKAVRP